jgi:hypothetical protein
MRKQRVTMADFEADRVACKCVECGRETSFLMAGFTHEQIREFQTNYHCPHHRYVSEEELWDMEVNGLQ